MGKKLCFGAALAVMTSLALTATAAADVTLGSTTVPTSGGPLFCFSPQVTFIQTASSGIPYAAPTAGVITQWSINTIGATGAASVNLVVARPAAGAYTIVAIDPETLASSLPLGSNVQTFHLASPISVNAGDTIAVNSPGSSVGCALAGTSVPMADTIAIATTQPTMTVPAVGQTIHPFGPGVMGALANVSADLVTSLDSAVTTSASPATPSAGNLVLLSSTVTNNGPASAPLSFTDIVPAGMSIASAFASGGSCSSLGQNVTCTTGTVAAGASDTVAVLVVPGPPGSYTNNVIVANTEGLTDPNTANNQASTTINVTNGGLTGCVVPKKLKGLPASFAKTLLKQLGCTVKVKLSHKHPSVRKGNVISVKPGAGSHPFDTKVTVQVSSG